MRLRHFCLPLPKKKVGFTLIELMIAVSIIGILASIALPKFADMVRKAREGTLKGNLGTLRNALSIYYADMEGQYPTDPSNLSSLTENGKYLTSIPVPVVPDYHPPALPPSVFSAGAYNSASAFFAASPGEPSAAYWVYFYDLTMPTTWGQIYVYCTHTDTRGTFWSSY